MVRRIRIYVGVALALLLGTAQAGGDPEAGKGKSTPCQACHGADGNSTAPQFPRLAGQYPDYLVQALIGYQTGARKNAVMAPFAAQLSQRDMEDLAAYYATRPNGLAVRP
jgi:cytochrome c553